MTSAAIMQVFTDYASSLKTARLTLNGLTAEHQQCGVECRKATKCLDLMIGSRDGRQANSQARVPV